MPSQNGAGSAFLSGLPSGLTGIELTASTVLGAWIGPLGRYDEGALDADFPGFSERDLGSILVLELKAHPRDGPAAGGQPVGSVDVVFLFAQNRQRHGSFGLTVELEEDRAEHVDGFGQS